MEPSRPARRPPPARDPNLPAARSNRDGILLFALGVVLGGLSVAAALSRLHLGASAFPLWVPLAMNAAIVSFTGALVGSGFIAYSSSSTPEDPYVHLPREEWERMVASLAARKRPEPVRALPPAPVAPIEPIVEPVVAPGSAEPGPLPTPTTADSPSSIASSSLAFLPVAGKPPPRSRKTRSGTRAREPQLSAHEIDEMERLGAALGVHREPSESADQFAARLLAVAEQARPSVPASPTSPKEGKPRAERKSAPPWKESDSSEAGAIDELMNALEELGLDGKRPPESEDE